MWQPPSLRLKWGPYFREDPGEQKQVIDMVQAALGKGSGLVDAAPLITQRHAIEKIAPLFGIENIDAVVDAIAEEATAKSDLATENLKKQQAAMGGSQSVVGSGAPANKPDPFAPPKK